MLKVFLQGAPENVLQHCMQYTIDGEPITFSEDGEEHLNILGTQIGDNMGAKGMVPISFASKEMPLREFEELVKNTTGGVESEEF